MEIKKNLILLFALVLIFSVVQAQELPVKNAKPYDTWIIKSDGNRTVRGILYDVQDSSIRINNPFMNSFASFHFQDINQIKIRRKNNVLKGALIGGGIGVIIPFIANPGSGKDYDFTPMINALISVPMGLMGAGIGAGIGSLKITIPIGGNRENFNAFRPKLNNFSLNKSNYPISKISSVTQPIYNQSTTISVTKPLKSSVIYEHENFIGLVSGPSFIIGDWDQNTTVNNKNYRAKTGYSSNLINIGYRLKGKHGLTFTLFQNQYDAKSGNPNEWWSLVGFTFGPMYSHPLSDKIFFDFRPRIGLASASINTDENTQFQGGGLVVNPSISFRYNFARRWCTFTEPGYLYSSPKIEDIGTRHIQSFNLGIGIAYRFK